MRSDVGPGVHGTRIGMEVGFSSEHRNQENGLNYKIIFLFVKYKYILRTMNGNGNLARKTITADIKITSVWESKKYYLGNSSKIKDVGITSDFVQTHY